MHRVIVDRKRYLNVNKIVHYTGAAYTVEVPYQLYQWLDANVGTIAKTSYGLSSERPWIAFDKPFGQIEIIFWNLKDSVLFKLTLG